MDVVKVDGGELWFETIDLVAPWIAAPETIFFVHGLGSVSTSWAQWLPALVDRYRIVRFDMRGHGRSVPFDAASLVSLDTLRDDMLAVAAAAGVEHFHYVGESVGGTLGLRLAASHGERLLSLTCTNTAHLGSSIQAVHDFEAFIAAHGMAGWSKRMMSGRFFDDALSPQARAWYEAQQSLPDPALVMRVVDILVGLDLTPDLPRIAARTLLMQADSSPFISVGMMDDINRLIPDSRLQVFAHGKHGLPVSHARECSALLRRFLDRDGSL